jgi:hypothetical protein
VATTPTLVMAASTSSPLTSRTDPGHSDAAAVHPLSSCHVADICRPARLVCLEEAAAGVLASLVAQRDQAAQVDRDVVGLAVVRVLYLS